MNLKLITKNKKGVQLNALPSMVLTLVVIAIILAIGARITQDIGDDMTENSTQESAAKNGTEALAELSSWLPLIGLIIAASVIIALVVGAFAFFGTPGKR